MLALLRKVKPFIIGGAVVYGAKNAFNTLVSPSPILQLSDDQYQCFINDCGHVLDKEVPLRRFRFDWGSIYDDHIVTYIATVNAWRRTMHPQYVTPSDISYIPQLLGYNLANEKHVLTLFHARRAAGEFLRTSFIRRQTRLVQALESLQQ